MREFNSAILTSRGEINIYEASIWMNYFDVNSTE